MERGKVRTGAIFIARGGATRLYRTLEEVPQRLRAELVKSTKGSNSGTVIIADQEGVRELLGGMVQQEAARQSGFPRWLRRYWAELSLAGVLALLLWLVFGGRF